jgi:hypothetical protein
MKKSQFITLVLVNAALASCYAISTNRPNIARQISNAPIYQSAIPENWLRSFAPEPIYTSSDTTHHNSHHSVTTHTHRGGFGHSHSSVSS